MRTWEEIRANWVNGNISDAKDMLYQQNKTRILKIINEAINEHLESLPNGIVMSGDLNDLREILSSFRK